jgi:uncharacterized damage-inducible protein DinB
VTPWTAPEADRHRPPGVADERHMLRGFVDYQRQTLLGKCQGLTSEQLSSAAVPPSALTLAGLVRHMADVERAWFRRRVAGLDLPWIFCTDEDRDAAFVVVGSDPEADLATYRHEIEEAETAVADLPLETTFVHPRWGRTLSLRWVYLHMIEEYARHNGHADLLRERIDGVTGE